MVEVRRWLGVTVVVVAAVALWLKSSDVPQDVNVEMTREARGRVPLVAPLVVQPSTPAALGAVEPVSEESNVAAQRITVRVVDEFDCALAGVVGSLEIRRGAELEKHAAESTANGLLTFTVEALDGEKVSRAAALTLRAPGRVVHRERLMSSGDVTLARRLVPGARVVVVDKEGRPVEGVAVTASDRSFWLFGSGCSAFMFEDRDVLDEPVDLLDEMPWYSAPQVSDENGHVVVPYAAGELSFMAKAPYGASGTRYVTAAERARGFTIELDASPIRGLVVDGLGRPVAGARVGGIGAGIATTGLDGRFALLFAEPGETHVAAVHEDYISARCEIEGDRQNVRIVFDRGATLHVHFVNEAHNPVDLRGRPELEVMFGRFGDVGRERRITPTLGDECVIRGLSPGLHQLSLRYDWFDGKKTLCSALIDVPADTTIHDTMVVP